MTHSDTFKALIKVALTLIDFHISVAMNSSSLISVYPAEQDHHRQAIISLRPLVALSDLRPANSSQEGPQDIVSPRRGG